MSKKKATPVEAPKQSASEALKLKLASVKMDGLVNFAKNSANADVRVIPTGFPQLDAVLHPTLKGFPQKRNIEVFSRRGSSGKSSLMARILANAQRLGYGTALADVEDTLTNDYLELNGVVTDPDFDAGIPALIKLEHNLDSVLSAEEWLERVRKLSNVLDVIVVDSVAALEKSNDLEKEMDDPNTIGGVSKLLSEWCRKTLRKNATIFWVNQMRSAVGKTSPNGQPVMSTPGGKALDFYSSIRLELTEIEKIYANKDGGDPLGIKVKVYCQKNKVAPPYRQATLNYLYGVGFSPYWDYLEYAIKVGAVIKKGGWLYLEDYKAQGLANMHRMLIEDPEMFALLKGMIDGTDVEKANIEDGVEPSKDDLEAAS
jgi:recombination protein RecA